MKQLFLSFIRGINVGGNNIIKMADLRNALGQEGFEDVQTYIQSGNVIFSSSSSDLNKHSSALEKALKNHFQISTQVVTFSQQQWKKCLKKAPQKWGQDPSWKHNILIIIPPQTAKGALKSIGEHKDELEWALAGEGVIYQSVSREGFNKSRYSKVAGLPVYQEMTVRNFNTASKLLKLLENSSSETESPLQKSSS